MSFIQKILFPLTDHIDTSDIEHKNIFESEGDRIALIGDGDSNLLVLGTGTDGSTDFPDISSSNHTVTAVGDAQVETGVTDPFGGNDGVYLGDGILDHLDINGNLSDFDLGSESWVAEGFFYLNEATGATSRGLFGFGGGFGGWNGTNGHIYICNIGSDGKFYFQYWAGSIVTISFTSPNFSTGWNFAQLTNDSVNNQFKIRINEIVKYTSSAIIISTITTPLKFTLGDIASGGAAWKGWLSNFRLSREVTRPTATPTEYFAGAYATNSPSPAAVWTALPIGAVVDVSTAKYWRFKDGVVITSLTDTDVQTKKASNGGSLGAAETLSAFRAGSDITITDATNSLKAVGVYASDGTYESKSSAWLEVDVLFPDAGGLLTHPGMSGGMRG